MNILVIIFGICIVAMLCSRPTKGCGSKFYRSGSTPKKRTKKEWWM